MMMRTWTPVAITPCYGSVDNTPNRHQEPRGSGRSETNGLNPATTGNDQNSLLF